MTDLLIISCSRTKKHLDNVPAIELYDGQAYRVIRKSGHNNVSILTISAKYGLIGENDRISYYDQLMTISRATELRDQVSSGILRILSQGHFQGIFVYLGSPYNLAISRDLIEYMDEHHSLQIASGSIGKRLHQLKEWLGVTER